MIHFLGLLTLTIVPEILSILLSFVPSVYGDVEGLDHAALVWLVPASLGCIHTVLDGD